MKTYDYVLVDVESNLAVIKKLGSVGWRVINIKENKHGLAGAWDIALMEKENDSTSNERIKAE